MSHPAPFRITYLGGGSRFVVTLLHGLAEYREQLAALGRPIELALFDRDLQRAGQMARYAEISARETGLDIRASVTNRLEVALEGAHWVILSVGLWERIGEYHRRFLQPLGNPHEATGAATAVEAAAVWPFLCEVDDVLSDVAAHPVWFSTLVNPTDVLAAAYERTFGVPSLGMCVEVPGLRGWLSYYLGVSESDLRLEHLGVNHIGWVSEWSVGGRNGAELFWERIPPRMKGDDWYPHCTWFVRVFQALGWMRSSPYHSWPYRTSWGEATQRQNERWARTCLPAGMTKAQYRATCLATALEEGRMIPEPDLLKVHPEATPYSYPNTRHTLGALTVGLAGGTAGPVPLQVPNNGSNRCLPDGAWIEAPVRLERGELETYRVAPLPELLLGPVTTLAHQRRLLADWLANHDRKALREALLLSPEVAELDSLVALSADLHDVVQGSGP